MPCNGPVVHPLPSCKFFFKEECWPKLEHNTVSKKQLLKRPCATKTLVYLEFQPQGGYFCSSNFPKFFCPIRLNRTPARNIYYKHIDYLCTFRSLIYIYIFYACVIAARCFYFFLWLPIKSPLVFSLFLKQKMPIPWISCRHLPVQNTIQWMVTMAPWLHVCLYL